MSQSISLIIAGVPRSYRIFLPEEARFQAFPVVIFLHGKGGTAEWAERETGWSNLAARESFVVVYPEALPPRRDREPKFLTNPPTWNDGSPHQHNRDVDDVGFIRELLQHLAREVAIDLKRIYLSGFSNGAAMAFRLANELPHSFAALAPVAGYCHVELSLRATPLPTMYLIGDADPLIPLHGGRVETPWRTGEIRPPIDATITHWRIANRFHSLRIESRDPTGTLWKIFGSEVPNREMRVGILPGLGHHWPGGLGGLGEKLGGPIAKVRNATEIIWDFFRPESL